MELLHNAFQLFVIAGPNGAGKSQFDSLYLPKNLTAFDYDVRMKEIYDQTVECELREEMARRTTDLEFQKLARNAVVTGKNLPITLIFIRKRSVVQCKLLTFFKKAGFNIHLLFFKLNSVEKAIERVALRVKTTGFNHVPTSEIKTRFTGSNANFEKYYKEFDTVFIYENNDNGYAPQEVWRCIYQ